MKKNTNFEIQGVGFILTITGLLKLLWNKLMPSLFGSKKITYKQSILLYLLCKILFDFRYTIKDSFKIENNSVGSNKNKEDQRYKKQDNNFSEPPINIKIKDKKDKPKTVKDEGEEFTKSKEDDKREIKSEILEDTKEV